jgi:hypothetical protein
MKWTLGIAAHQHLGCGGFDLLAAIRRAGLREASGTRDQHLLSHAARLQETLECAIRPFAFLNCNAITVAPDGAGGPLLPVIGSGQIFDASSMSRCAANLVTTSSRDRSRWQRALRDSTGHRIPRSRAKIPCFVA